MPLSKAIMKGILKWLWHDLWMKDMRLPKIALFVKPSRAERKAGYPWLWRENVAWNYVREIETS